MKLLYTDLKINNCEVISDGVRKLKRHISTLTSLGSLLDLELYMMSNSFTESLMDFMLI